MTTATVQIVGAIAVHVLGYGSLILAMIHLARWMQQAYQTDAAADTTYITTAEHETTTDTWVDQQLMRAAKERHAQAD